MRTAIWLLFISAAWAQSTGASSGAISGKVVDIIGEPVANAPIQATNVATKAVLKGSSSSSGAYSLAPVPAGTYTLTVNMPGFNPFVQQNVAVASAQTVSLDLHIVDFQFNTLGDGRDFRAALLTEHPTPKGPAPRLADGKLDLSGVYYPLRVTDPGRPEMLPWAAALFKQRTDENTKDSPFTQCLPRAAALIGGQYPFKVVQTPALVILLFEDSVPSHREIFMDGRPHPKDVYSWMGHAIGHWEGDTLVVDRAGFNDSGWLLNSGQPHTDKLHITERFRRPNLGHLEVEMTFDDAGAYARPWTLKGVYDYEGTDELQEFICNENNRDPTHMVGK